MTRVWLNGFEQISCLGVGAGALADVPAPGHDAWRMAHPRAGVTSRFDYFAVAGVDTNNVEARQMDELARYSVACASLLLKRAPGREGQGGGEKTGCILGSAFGCTASNQAYLEALIASGPRRTSPVVFRNTVSNAAAGHLAVGFRMLGSNSVLNSGMVAGVQALTWAHRAVSTGRCDEVLAGGADWSSALVQKRFAAQGERYGRPTLPLLDGAGLFLLGAKPAPDCDWEVAGYGLGFLNNGEREASLKRILCTALETAGASWQDVDALAIQRAEGALWVRSSPKESFEALAAEAGRTCALPFPENTALPAMLGLGTTLRFLAGRAGSLCFINSGAVHRVDETPECFLFAAIGADGSSAALVFKRRTDGESDAKP